MRRKFLLPATALALLAGAWISAFSAPISSTVWQVLIQSGVASGTTVDSTIHPVIIASGSVLPPSSFSGTQTFTNQTASTTSPNIDILWDALNLTPPNPVIKIEGSAASNAWKLQIDSVANGGGLYLLSDKSIGTLPLQCYPGNGTTLPDICELLGDLIRIYDADLLHTTTINGPATASVNRTLTLPTTQVAAGQSLVGLAAGTTQWISVSDHFGANGLLGGLTSTAASTLAQSCIVAPRAGHFTTLDCTTDFITACTTAPGFNVHDNNTSGNGTAKVCGTAAGAVTQAQTLTFAAGDTICIARTQNGAVCTAPQFSVVATIVYP